MNHILDTKQFVKVRNEIKSCTSHKHYPPSYLYVAPYTKIIHECSHCNHQTKVEGKSILE